MQRTKSVRNSRSFSLRKTIRSPDRKSPFSSHESHQVSRRSLGSITSAITKHISMKADVQIIVYYPEYYKQFFTKCKHLQDYLYKAPAGTRQKYMNENDPHFKYGLQHLMLDLFRRGVITAGSHDNMRKQAVQQIQLWVLGWIQRQKFKEQLAKEEMWQINKILELLEQMQAYVEEIEMEESGL